MEANSATAHQADPQGIPLDLEPLLEPHLHHARLSVRVEQLPSRARLSKGHNNGDCTFSLKPEDLIDLFYLPPDGAGDPRADLAVRIVKLDDDYATTLELIDLKVPSGSQSKEPKKRTIRFSGTPDRHKGETVVQLDASRSDARVERHPAPDLAPADASVETQKLQRAFDVLSQTLAQTEARAADAEMQAEQAAAQNAALAARVGEAEAAAENARAEAKAAFESELTQLRQQLDAAATDVDDVHKRALEAAAAAHAREIAELEKTHARVLQEKVSATKEELEGAFKGRRADAQRQAEDKARDALATAREEWQAEEAERSAAARKEFEVELSQLRQKLDDASLNFDEMRKQALDAAAADHAREIAALESAHANALEEQTTAITEKLEQAFAGRLADAQRQAEETAAAQLKKARQQWQAEEAERSAAAKKEFEVELSQLRQKLDDASLNFDETRKQALDAAAADHAREIAALESAHADALEEQTTVITEKLEQAFAGRHETALREAADTAKGELEKARQAWQAEADTALAAAREDWQTEEAERSAAARKEFEIELSQLRQKLDDASLNFDETRKQALDAAAADHAREIAALESSHADALEEQTAVITEKLEQEFTERLADARNDWERESGDDRVAEALRQAEETAKAALEKARQEWAVEAEASLAAAQETWKVEEAERLAAAFKVWQGQPPKEKKLRRLPTLPRFRMRLWLPPRSLAVKVAIIGLLGFALMQPEVKSRFPAVKTFAAERSEIAATELRIYFDPLISKLTGSEPLPEAMPPQSTEAPTDSVERATIGVGRANIRSGPSTGASVIKTLEQGRELIVLGTQGSWLQVRFGEGVDEAGWIHSDLLGAAP
jgi:hypothetical protein